MKNKNLLFLLIILLTVFLVAGVAFVSRAQSLPGFVAKVDTYIGVSFVADFEGDPCMVFSTEGGQLYKGDTVYVGLGTRGWYVDHSLENDINPSTTNVAVPMNADNVLHLKKRGISHIKIGGNIYFFKRRYMRKTARLAKKVFK